MSAITEESARRTILALTSNLSNAKADAGRWRGHLDGAETALVYAMWEVEAAVRAGQETMPTVDVASLLRRVWDAATLGSAVPTRGARP